MSKWYFRTTLPDESNEDISNCQQATPCNQTLWTSVTSVLIAAVNNPQNGNWRLLTTYKRCVIETPG